VKSVSETVQIFFKKTVDTPLAFCDSGGTHGNNINKNDNMRAKKTLLAAAATLAAGLLTVSAQTYSANVVGYVNLTLTNGFNLVANQLDVDGTGTNNTIYTCIGTNVPNLTRVYAFDPANGYSFVTYLSSSGTWTGSGLAAVNAACQPGGALFIQIPASASYPQTVTLVGTVLQGSLTNKLASGLYQQVSSKVPMAGGLQTVLDYTPDNLDRVYQWLPASQTYGSAHTYLTGSGTWTAGEPTLQVGESVFLLSHANSVWVNNFQVQ
jgi:hypothetical protein